MKIPEGHVRGALSERLGRARRATLTALCLVLVAAAFAAAQAPRQRPARARGIIKGTNTNVEGDKRESVLLKKSP